MSHDELEKVAGLMPDVPRQGGYGPATTDKWYQKAYTHPAAGWGATVSVGKILTGERQVIRGTKAMFTINHPDKGFDCPGCAWPDAKHFLPLDVCENGVKHSTWEMTDDRATPEFFAEHTVTELAEWTDFALEDVGRLTHPMSYDPGTDTYVPVPWEEAFAIIGDELNALGDPNRAAFYTSGRLSNEASFLYQLMAREFGTNNLPDCSNMCHEASGRALRASLATGKGTTDVDDWEVADTLFIMGVNAATNAPRMLTLLTEAYARGAQIVHINPLIEAGARKAIVPHDLVDMALNKSTPTSTMNLQVRPGGDFALMRGIAKVVFEEAEHDPKAIDREFLDAHTEGWESYRDIVRATPWADIVTQSGLTESEIRGAAVIYLASEATIISWCLGLSQHEFGVSAIREIVNVLLLRGNIGRPGAGPAPVRGHSNVQGNRTCGIDHRPTEEFLTKLDAVCGITSPREHGLTTVTTMKALHDGDVKVFIGMGGNFVRAVPDPAYTAEGMAQCSLTVHVSTKLNRSHLTHGAKALILPCLARTERDETGYGLQRQSCEDAMSNVQLSLGKRRPASDQLLSEPAILAGIARATMPDSATPWERYAVDYDAIRDVMAKVLPGFEGFNTVVRGKYGFRIPQPARERDFRTPSGRAEFCLADLPNVVPDDDQTIVLQTIRSHDQWNTTIYTNDDRYRGVKNIREIVFMHADDMAERGIPWGGAIDLVSTSKDGSQRTARGFRAVSYDLPRGSAAGYMPELNVLIGPKDYSELSDQPLMKSIQVRITASR